MSRLGRRERELRAKEVELITNAKKFSLGRGGGTIRKKKAFRNNFVLSSEIYSQYFFLIKS